MQKKSLIFFVFLTLAFLSSLLASFSSAQNALNPVLVDKSFVPYSSADCGNVNTDCLLAVTTGMLISLNKAGVVGNETEFVIHVKDVLSTFPAPLNYTGGYFVHEVMNATTQILR